MATYIREAMFNIHKENDSENLYHPNQNGYCQENKQQMHVRKQGKRNPDTLPLMP
jgi:hypothetical protein